MLKFGAADSALRFPPRGDFCGDGRGECCAAILPLLTSAGICLRRRITPFGLEIYTNMPIVMGSEPWPYGDTPRAEKLWHRKACA